MIVITRCYTIIDIIIVEQIIHDVNLLSQLIDYHIVINNSN